MSAEVLHENAFGAYRVRLGALLHIPADASDLDIHDLIEAGFSAGCVTTLCDLGVINATQRNQIISLQTLKTRLSRNQPLSPGESDRLFRFARIIAIAQALFGDHEKATHWLVEPKDRFLGRSAVAMLSTIQGAHMVEEMLIQLAEDWHCDYGAT